MENKKRGIIEDMRTVDLTDDYTVEYWTQELRTTKAKITAAIVEVGDVCEAVKKQLKRPPVVK